MIIEVFSSFEGSLYACNAWQGQRIITDQVLFVIKHEEVKKIVYSPADGILAQVEVSLGDYVVKGMLLACIISN